MINCSAIRTQFVINIELYRQGNSVRRIVSGWGLNERKVEESSEIRETIYYILSNSNIIEWCKQHFNRAINSCRPQVGGII